MALKVRLLHNLETSETKYLVTSSHIIEGLVPNYFPYPLPLPSHFLHLINPTILCKVCYLFTYLLVT